MSSQTLCGSSDDDNDGFSWTFSEDVGAGTFGDGGHAEEKDDISVDWWVGCRREMMDWVSWGGKREGKGG